MRKRFRLWRLRRRLNRILTGADVPNDLRVIFTGNVRILEARYDPDPTAWYLAEAWEKGDTA